MNYIRFAALSALVSTPLFMCNPAIAQTVDHAPVDLPDSQKMVPTGAETWTYNDPSANFLKYRTVIIDAGEVPTLSSTELASRIGPDTRKS